MIYQYRHDHPSLCTSWGGAGAWKELVDKGVLHGRLELGRGESTKVFFMGGWSSEGADRQRCCSWGGGGAWKGWTDKGVVHGGGGSLEGVDRQRSDGVAAGGGLGGGGAATIGSSRHQRCNRALAFYFLYFLLCHAQSNVNAGCRVPKLHSFQWKPNNFMKPLGDLAQVTR